MGQREVYMYMYMLCVGWPLRFVGGQSVCELPVCNAESAVHVTKRSMHKAAIQMWAAADLFMCVKLMLLLCQDTHGC